MGDAQRRVTEVGDRVQGEMRQRRGQRAAQLVVGQEMTTKLAELPDDQVAAKTERLQFTVASPRADLCPKIWRNGAGSV